VPHPWLKTSLKDFNKIHVDFNFIELYKVKSDLNFIE